MKLRDYYKIIEMLVDTLYFFKKNELDDERIRHIVTFISGMSLSLENNRTLDPAIWHDWIEAVTGNRNPDVVPQTLTIKEAYDAAIRFLVYSANRLESADIKQFADQLTFEKWEKAVEEMLKSSDDKA